MSVPILEIEGTWEEIAQRADEFAGRRLRVTLLPAADEIKAEEINVLQHYTARELMKLPPHERNRILEKQAVLAEPLYRNDPELTDFEAFGDDDIYDETP